MDPDSTILQIVILLVLIAINAFFAMSEIAIVTFNDNKLKKMAEDGNKRAAILHKMVSEPSKFLSTKSVSPLPDLWQPVLPPTNSLSRLQPFFPLICRCLPLRPSL